LIQGVSQHAGMTLHHLVRDELNALDLRLLLLYDHYALVNLLQFWDLDAVLLLGRPQRFWRRAATERTHPFFSHPLLSRYGGILAEAGRQRAIERAKEKRFTCTPILFSFQAIKLVNNLRRIEAPHRPDLIELARKVAARVWGIPIDRLHGELTTNVAFGKLSKSRTLRAAITRLAAVGYGGVVQDGDSLIVVGKATNWLLLAKELVKGTAELICLHGLTNLNDEMYKHVIHATDRIDFEPPMLQTGGELWRRLLALVPTGLPIAHLLMNLSRLPPKSLETLMLAIFERPQWAAELLAALGTEDASL
jgi:hypothetical protein